MQTLQTWIFLCGTTWLGSEGEEPRRGPAPDGEKIQQGAFGGLVAEAGMFSRLSSRSDATDSGLRCRKVRDEDVANQNIAEGLRNTAEAVIDPEDPRRDLKRPLLVAGTEIEMAELKS